MTDVPIIDLAAIDDTALTEIDAACRDHGFFLIKNHGIDAEAAIMWQESAAFFASDHDTKASVRRTADYPIGYYDRELTKRARDQKEVFDYFVEPDGMEAFVRWPCGLDAFRQSMQAYHNANIDLAIKVTRLVCKALGVNEHALDSTFTEGHSSITRLNHYPADDPVPAGEAENLTPLGDMSLHHHTDTGLLTLLMQDDVGGLQAYSAQDGWIDVPPIPGSIVVNMADMMQVWTNDTYKAALHRVVRQPVKRSRYSSPFFFQPGNQTVIAPLSSLGRPHFRPFAWREFIDGRVADNYGDIGEDDIQIDRFRIA